MGMSDDHTSLPPAVDLELLQRYLRGDALTHEATAVQRWVGESPRHASIVEALRPRTGVIAGGETWDTEAALTQLHRRMTIPSTNGAARVSPSTPARGLRKTVWWGAAAGMFAAAALAVVWTSSRLQSSVHADVTEHATGNGEQTELTLRDGTRVRLNVASRLRVPRDFGSGSRTVELEGEAQFVVTHDPARPFVVAAHGTLVRDLATDFIVRAYTGSSHTLVAVRDGRVAIQSPRVTASGVKVVDPDHIAMVGTDGTTHVARSASIDGYFAWTTGTLTLLEAPAGEALAQLSRWYDLDFRVTDSSMLEGKITLTLSRTLDGERLNAIADMFGARATRSGRVVTLAPVHP
jgi:transmembrane sensor